MSIDYYLAKEFVSDNDPVLRFYGWDPYCLSLGKHQSLKNVDLSEVSKSGFDLVRRPTGGSAIFHSEELTYSFIIPGRNLNHHMLYLLFHVHLRDALIKLGYEITLEEEKTGYQLNQDSKTFACFNRAAYSELRYNGKKIVGSAQKILKESLLQHGSILLGKQHLTITRFLKMQDSEREYYKNLLRNQSSFLLESENKKFTKQSLIDHLLEEFKKHYNIHLYIKPLTPEEYIDAKKYQNEFVITLHGSH